MNEQQQQDLLELYGETYDSLKKEMKTNDLAQKLLVQSFQQLVWFWNTYNSCACGARKESLDTHPHVLGCPTSIALEQIREKHWYKVF